MVGEFGVDPLGRGNLELIRSDEGHDGTFFYSTIIIKMVLNTARPPDIFSMIF